MPGMIAPAPAGGLLLGQENRALRRAGAGCLQGCVVRGSRFVRMVNVPAEYRAFHQRRYQLREKKIGHCFQTVAGCGVSGDFHSELAQVLHQSPDFGATGPKLRSKLGSAYDDRRMVNENSYDASQMNIALWAGRWWRLCFSLRSTFLCSLCDAEIMRDNFAKDNESHRLTPGRPACSCRQRQRSG